MDKIYKKSMDPGFIISAAQLKKKQAVRATFRLPEHICLTVGVKTKSLFDLPVNIDL